MVLASSQVAIALLGLMAATAHRSSHVVAISVPLDSTGSIVSMFNDNINTHGAAASNGSLFWQPLRATFRPAIRAPSRPEPPTPPQPPEPPQPFARDSRVFSPEGFVPASRVSRDAESVFEFAPPTTPTPAPADDERPTRVPLARFRPTRPPSSDEDPADGPPSNSGSSSIGASGNAGLLTGPPTSGAAAGPVNETSLSSYQITSECFECICEASTNCNPQSRCQTSDVRHTRCGMYLISYEQWLDSGLSSQLVSREQLARDISADERAFYDCVTHRNCAQQVLSLYMQHNLLDCDKDGRLDCYDVAAIHQGGRQNCNSEPLLDSQYWSEFNACYGFAR